MRDRTELIAILDRSGSMEQGRADHEGGLRAFVRDQRALPGDVRLTFVLFDTHDPFEVVYDGVSIADVDDAKLELVPRGGTPLLEAVGRTLDHVAARLAKAGEPPGMVVVMVITDGEENSSGKAWTKERIKARIAEREAAGWKVLYLGANVDEFGEAGALGIGAGATLGYAATPVGTQGMYAALSQNVTTSRRVWRSSGSLDQAYASLNYTPDQRMAASTICSCAIPLGSGVPVASSLTCPIHGLGHQSSPTTGGGV